MPVFIKLGVVHCQIIIPIFILSDSYFLEGEIYSSSVLNMGTLKVEVAEIFSTEKKSLFS